MPSEKPYVIALEEHYEDPAMSARADARRRASGASDLATKLADLGEPRLREMDAAWIDMQVISHAPSPIQQLEPKESVPEARAMNDRLHDAVGDDPGVLRRLLARFPGLSSAAWGYTIDTANQVVRMILSGLFEAYPNLKIIVGHMGESIPFLVDRIDEVLKRPGSKPIAFKDTFCQNFYITTSGHFSTPALMCALMEMGIDCILFSVGWPFVDNEPGTRWMETVPLSAVDREKVLSGNARRLLKM